MAITGSQPSYMYALGGYARGGATRGGDTDPQTYITIGGVQVGAVPAVAAQHVMDGTLAIVETEGATPNTASFQVMGLQPTDGQEVIMTQGSKHNLDRLFAGTILTDVHGYVGTPANYNEVIHVIDYTWQLTRDTFSQRWQTKSATGIAQDIIAKAAGRGITATFVAAGLPVLDEFSVTDQTPAQALSALADRIGGYWKTLYASRVAGQRADVRFGLTTDTWQTDPTTVTLASAALTRMENFSVTRDLSPVITRQAVEGGGSSAMTEVGVGETILPVPEITWYNAAAGGTVVSGPQRVTYTGVTVGGAGSLVGPAASPSSALVPSLRGGAGVDAGVHQYGYTFVTAAGETIVSPLASVTTGVTVPTPGGLDSVTNGTTAISYPPANLSAFVRFTVTAAMVGYYVYLYRSEDGGTTYYNIFQWGPFAAGDVGVQQLDNERQPHKSSGTTPPGVSTATFSQVTLASLAIGPTGTTQRKVYRTAAGGTQPKLQQTRRSGRTRRPGIRPASPSSPGKSSRAVRRS
jgi:hypothetical protein